MLNEELECLDWTVQKACAYKFAQSVDFAFSNLSNAQLMAFNNIVIKSQVKTVDVSNYFEQSPTTIIEDLSEQNPEYIQALRHEWSYGQALAVSKLSTEDALSQKFTNAELAAVKFGASIDQIKDYSWNEHTNFFLKKSLSAKQIMTLGEEGVSYLFFCAMDNMSSSTSESIKKTECDFQ